MWWWPGVTRAASHWRVPCSWQCPCGRVETKPPWLRSDPGHDYFSLTSPVPLCPTLGHPWVTLPLIPTPGTCSSLPQTAKNLGFVCKVQFQGSAAINSDLGY